MLDALLPRTIDNTYRGGSVALWLFGVVVFWRIAQSVLLIFNGYSTVKGVGRRPTARTSRTAHARQGLPSAFGCVQRRSSRAFSV